ncbi:hypothetical protein [Formosa algae]|uniref:Purine-cytosine permease-like protein n=1 Tax=Formosa algae TaxID=225843 RepID=A0A9X1CD53_9FLAO|nr:hypothetical protein [Formosa algae]MBP1840859.1 purine-cytosine permease-like protein [Formosa algae]MDQ0336244.1 purine-cytosine permease-like protein [Formosa algae]OEI80015.1 hypothetical protein AST99_12090 [Formosa algae]PNW28350.1 hypothetical protein BKP44_09415 [Formosa algae]
MRTDNGNVKNTIISVYFVLIVLAIVLATVFRAFSDLTNNFWLTFVIVFSIYACVFLAVYLIAKYFEYDSDGEQIVVTNKGLLLSERFNYRAHEIEFEKKDLIGFKFKNYLIYRCLVLYIKSDKSTIKERFNTTLVTSRKRRYIGQSLSKIVKKNISNKA